MRLGGRPVAVKVCADRRGTVRIGATQAKLEARFDIGLGVILLPIGDNGGPGARMRAVPVGVPRPGLRLVQMHMAIDEARPQLTPIQIDAVRRRSGRRHRGNAATGDAQISPCQTLGVDRKRGIQQPGRSRGVTQPEVNGQ